MKALLTIIIIVAVIVIGVILVRHAPTSTTVNNVDVNSTSTVDTSTSTTTPPVSTTTPPTATTTTTADQSVSDGTIKALFSPKEFGVAMNKSQIPVSSYIPPCGDNFNYCLYYIGTAYKGTNFDSAGIRIQKRADLVTERPCLDTPPDGFSASTTPDKTNSLSAYSVSVFKNVGDAGAGHTASGSLYRLFVRKNSVCYEFETRIGETQFANYPPGTIKEFTAADKTSLISKLTQILGKVSLVTGEKGLFAGL